jgi:pimeloyl-ACP methyl ester carboxylesterase
MPFPYLDEAREMDEAARRAAGGRFVALTDGITHYEIAGPAGSPPIVLVHGFSVPAYVFDGTFEFFAESGFRVLRYDLFGRGWSDRPALVYDIHLFVRQLSQLFDALGLERAHLLGLSMGGPVAAAFAVRFPQRVENMIFIDPAGAGAVSLPRLIELVKLPVVGEIVLGLFGSGAMLRGIASGYYRHELIEAFQERYRVQMQFVGFKRALLSTLRSGMLRSFIETYARAGQLKKPSLLIWGREDKTIPIDAGRLLQQAIPHAEFHAIEGAGHIPHFERPAVVHPILAEFLNRKAI